ncbi:hypothetical protein JTE90_001342 [Oedothorax gibbosus]|uniref:Cyclic nucleotide-binding domain-containing protein n=1 Tax=Oedothorax gibbosus TaxID=931172 RepID=A0AAV6V2N1_9ARAC|nr:hypothetical protein JTE90_001342 [Oedothorax gibbosus]
MASYAYNAWSILFRAVFPYQTKNNLPIFLAFDYICDIIYVIDIAVFKVRLQFLHNGFWVENFSQTKANYFRKREFKLDLISLLPLDLLYFVYGTNPLFRLPRFLKVQTFWEFFNRVDAVTKTPYVIRIIRTLMYMMYLIHLNACAYYAMSTWEGIGSNRWVFQGVGNAYIRCFYFATKTATSIGKNPKPENEIEYIFMTISWLMGVFIFAFLVGQIRDIVATATQSRTQYRQLMDQTVMYMRNLNLPDELQKRVRMWLNHNWEQQKTFNVGKILDTLPRKMKTDVAINVHYKTLVKVQLFKDCDKALLRDLVLQLKPVLFLPGDFICKKGEVGKEMYIVNKGIVEVLGGDDGGLVLATLTKGSVFGEISLLGIPGCNRRTADVRSKGFSNLFVLSKDDLWEALKNYPEAQKVLKKKAKNIIKENEERAQATKAAQAQQTSSSTNRESYRTAEDRSHTPRLVKTVLQVFPKSCHRIQPHSSKSTKNSFSNIPSSSGGLFRHTEQTDVVSENIPSCSNKIPFRNRKVSISPPTQKPTHNLKPRSMSDGTLQKQTLSLFHSEKSSNNNVDFPFIIKKISPTKSEPSGSRHLNSNEENRSGSFSAILNAQLEKKRPDSFKRPKRHQPTSTQNIDLQSVNRNEQSSAENINMQSLNKSALQKTDSSESSIIKSSSDDDNINSTNCTTSDSSSMPYLKDLFNPNSESLTSLGNSVHLSSREEQNDTENKSPKSLVCSEDKNHESPSLSSSSSIICLGAIFHQDSEQSSKSSSRILPLSPDIADLDVSTNDSSSMYDNLSFVPTSILSRRSSIFSDTSE